MPIDQWRRAVISEPVRAHASQRLPGSWAEEKGFAAASLDEIAARAGMTKGAIYSNFGDKAELMVAAAMAHGISPSPSFTPGADLKTHLREFAEALANQLPDAEGRARTSSAFELFVLTQPELRRKVADHYERALTGLCEMLETAHGPRLALDAQALTLACQALGLGYLHQCLLTPGAVTQAAMIKGFEALADGATKS